jgi:hypothetical protein
VKKALNVILLGLLWAVSLVAIGAVAKIAYRLLMIGWGAT